MSCRGTAQRSSGGGPCVLLDGGRAGSTTSLLCLLVACTRLFHCSASFLSKTISVDEKVIKFQIWDTAGQEKVCVCRVQHVVCFLQALFVDGAPPFAGALASL